MSNIDVITYVCLLCLFYVTCRPSCSTANHFGFLFSHVYNSAPEDVTLCKLVKESYDIHLSPFHPWVVRKAVGLGLHALPTREQLVDHIVENQPKGSKLVGREACRVAMLELAIPAMRSVYECTHHWLTLHNMLNLP
ncbi:hypothetical protein P879_06951 [Paragonimus westermani]|uniref:Glycolipid transfer protein domain-containing protein n=1 Tax=Paragonimus westermani TaxID=34504 RepID=A0A8T0D6U5_9TREM|nr:hypothetical protein P879_06951 [Paragonimus westermani]